MLSLPAGFVIPQAVPDHSWLRRGVSAPANRFNIKPGRHWDGVDRGTGLEGQMLTYRNERAGMQLEARLIGMEDM